MLSNLLELNDTQTGVLYSCFKIADDNGLLLLDLKDLRAMLQWMGDESKALQTEYAIFPVRVLAPYNGNYWCSKSRAQNTFLANPQYNWMISVKPISRVMGLSVFSMRTDYQITAFIRYFFILAVIRSNRNLRKSVLPIVPNWCCFLMKRTCFLNKRPRYWWIKSNKSSDRYAPRKSACILSAESTAYWKYSGSAGP